MFNVKNRWAFITGASRGIGKLSAVFMAKQGCNLILHARKIENLSDVIISLADPGWCRTDLGGPQAPNAPESTIPGIVIGAFVDDGKSGRLFGAQDYNGLTLEEAYEKAQKKDSPYNK